VFVCVCVCVLCGWVYVCVREIATRLTPHSLPSRGRGGPASGTHLTFFFFFITLGLEMSDTKVYEP